MRLKGPKPELLAPAGNLDKLKTAFHYGADAVYAGMSDFSLRANAGNFDQDDLVEAVEYTRSIGKKIFLLLNAYFTPDQAENFIHHCEIVEALRPDAVVVSDIGAFHLVKKHAPSVPIHISTQANTTNQYAAEFLQAQGAERIVVARELSIDQIKMISDHTGMEIEAFVHGAMCIAYSGRCLLSSYMTHPALAKRENDKYEHVRSANKGDCSHSCRWDFTITENSRRDHGFPIEQDGEGTSILSSRDICMIDHIPDLVDAGVTSFKIEGRMKSALYVSSIIRAWRQSIDHCYDPSVPYDRELVERELNVVSHREFSTGFFYDSPREVPQVTEGGVYTRSIRLAARVTGLEGGRASLYIYNTIGPGVLLEYIGRGMVTKKIGSFKLFDDNGLPLEKANNGKPAFIEMRDNAGDPVVPVEHDILRMVAEF
jgi:putative protease